MGCVIMVMVWVVYVWLRYGFYMCGNGIGFVWLGYRLRRYGYGMCVSCV
jgi:hypothetical protein